MHTSLKWLLSLREDDKHKDPKSEGGDNGRAGLFEVVGVGSTELYIMTVAASCCLRQ
jgi:hypothetical protein